MSVSGSAGFINDPVVRGVSAMVERSELQRMARTIDAHRKQLDDIHTQIERLTKVIEEHNVTTGILSHLQKGVKSGATSARLSIGSGVTLRYTHPETEQGTALIDLGSGVFGEKPWDEAETITRERLDGIEMLQKELKEQSSTLEEKITVLAEAFNEAASNLTEATQQPPTQPVPVPSGEPEPSEEPATDESQRRPTRRSSRRSKELTLDD